MTAEKRVKRYRLYKHGTREKIDLSVSEYDGDFVRYEDYAALERELYLLRNERDNLVDNMHRLTTLPAVGSGVAVAQADPTPVTRTGK